jgi:hypothetical protein
MTLTRKRAARIPDRGLIEELIASAAPFQKTPEAVHVSVSVPDEPLNTA